eukprot:scaffold170448_cov23-Tisochrysis_lutea.AAC.2
MEGSRRAHRSEGEPRDPIVGVDHARHEVLCGLGERQRERRGGPVCEAADLAHVGARDCASLKVGAPQQREERGKATAERVTGEDEVVARARGEGRAHGLAQVGGQPARTLQHPAVRMANLLAPGGRAVGMKGGSGRSGGGRAPARAPPVAPAQRPGQ